MANKKETKVAENKNCIAEFEKEEALWNVFSPFFYFLSLSPQPQPLVRPFRPPFF